MWDNINIIINRKRPNSHIEKLYADDKCYQQPQSIANILNSCFCNIPSSLASKLPKTNMKPGSYLPRKTSKFKFSRVSELEVFLSLENLNTKKSFGADKVHPLLVSIAIFQIYRPITHITNLSISQGIFPDSMKIAKVVPIFKQGSRSSCDNYRPVSILPTLSNIFEKCIFNQLMFYLVNEDILTPRQYGFLPASTTIDCLVDLIEEITASLDHGDYAVSLFLDLSKAFDTVNHQILLNKLAYYGILDIESNWFRSYLNNRKQKVYINGIISDLHQSSSGVPQASILGSLVFIIFVNDFPNASAYFSFRLYADDTSLTVSGNDLDKLLSEINNHLIDVFHWLCRKKLTLNLSKTKYVIFQPRQKVNYNLYLPLVLADQILQKSQSVKYLGVYIDSNLAWNDHIDCICSKISKNLNIMTRLKVYLTSKSLVSVYYSLIYPYLYYGCPL